MMSHLKKYSIENLYDETNILRISWETPAGKQQIAKILRRTDDIAINILSLFENTGLEGVCPSGLNSILLIYLVNIY